MNRRESLIGLGAMLISPLARAQDYPSKPIRLISAFTAGGGSDFVARLLSAKLSPALGQAVVVENKPGAGGMLGTDYVAKSAPDGYTVLIGSNGPLAVLPALGAKTPYDAQRDLQPVALLTRHPYVLSVNASSHFKDMKAVIDFARSRPGELNYGTPGTGSAHHLAVEAMKIQAGINITHVPYKGVSQALTDLLGGQVQLVTTDVNSAMPLVTQGKIRAVGVTTAKRSPLLPDVATVAESGVPGYEVPGWFAALIRAGTPKPIVDRLHAELVKAMASPEAKEALGGLGGELLASTPAQLAAHIRSETQRWHELATRLNIKPEM